MPNLQAVLDESSFNGMDETLKTFYTQNSENKNYYLNVDGADKIAFNLQADLKKKEDLLKRAHDEKNDLKSKYTPFESLGKTAEEIKQALESNRPEEFTKLLEAEKLKSESIEKSLKEELEKTSVLANQRKEQLLNSAVQSEIAKLSTQFGLNDAAPFVLQNFLKAEEGEDGNVSVRVYENGQPALVAGEAKSAEKLLQQFREEKKFLSIFNAGSEGGTGGFNSQKQNFSGSKTVKRDEWAKMDAKTKSTFIGEGGKVID